MSNKAMAAGNSENNDHTIISTELVTEAGSMDVLPIASVIILAPAQPSSNAMSEPEMAVPNFCDIVPDEKISPVADVPKCLVW